MAKIYRVIQIKVNQLVRLSNKAYLSAITVTNIFHIFTYNMAAKMNWHRYGTKLRQCHFMYSTLIQTMRPSNTVFETHRNRGK